MNLEDFKLYCFFFFFYLLPFFPFFLGYPSPSDEPPPKDAESLGIILVVNNPAS